ncbi:hypothetical protein ABZP36_020601 [Zizania latifolia]
MDILEQPLEAIAFSIYSLPEAAAPGAAAWTCIAAVLAAAAAAGLWRIRAATPVAMAANSSFTNPLESESSPEAAASSLEQARSSGRAPEPDSSPAPSPKERYTAYYDSGCVGCCGLDDDEDGDEVVEEEDDGVYEPSETETFEWEVVRSLPLSRTAAADVGRYRDSSPLGGCVVRLWDQAAGGGFMAAAVSTRRRGRTGVVSSY